MKGYLDTRYSDVLGRTGRYTIVGCVDGKKRSVLVIPEKGIPDLVTFKTIEDYDNFVTDFKGSEPFFTRGDDFPLPTLSEKTIRDRKGIIDRLLEKTKVEWPATIPVADMYAGLEGRKKR